MGVSSSDTSATAAASGDSKIVPQGQTSGPHGNDPYITTANAKPDAPVTPLKPE